MTAIKLPHFNLPNLNLPTVNLPAVELPTIDTAKVASIAQDAVYITVGLGVLAFQQLQVRRQELTKRFTALEAQLGTAESRFAEIEAKIDQLMEQVKSRLPEPAEKLFDKAYETAKTTRKQVVDLITKAA